MSSGTPAAGSKSRHGTPAVVSIGSSTPNASKIALEPFKTVAPGLADPLPVNGHETLPTSTDVLSTPGCESLQGMRVPPEVLKDLPAFIREGESFFRTVGASSNVWGNLVVNWIRLEQTCKVKGVSHLLSFSSLYSVLHRTYLPKIDLLQLQHGKNVTENSQTSLPLRLVSMLVRSVSGGRSSSHLAVICRAVGQLHVTFLMIPTGRT